MSSHITTNTASTNGRGTVLASRPLIAWRTVDILTVAFLGVALGVVYWGWGAIYSGPSTALGNLFPPLQGITGAPWLLAGVIGGLVIRRPGAALLCEMIAAVVSALIGTQWGLATLVSGFLQGLGAEIAFAIFGYGVYKFSTALLAGALSAPLEAIYEWFVYWTDWGMGYKIAYAVILTVAGAAIAGTLGWVLTRALAGAGALDNFPPGQEVRESRAV